MPMPNECDIRERRQAEALKANLRRRKAQSRAADAPVAQVLPSDRADPDGHPDS
jgi:hypothetical protein